MNSERPTTNCDRQPDEANHNAHGASEFGNRAYVLSWPVRHERNLAVVARYSHNLEPVVREAGEDPLEPERIYRLNDV